LVFGHEIVHVGLSLGEFHLVHAFSGLPVEECLSPEHGGELLCNSLEHLLDGSRVSDEGYAHLESLWRDVADGRLDVVRDPLDELGGVLVLDVEHLLVDLLGGHAATEHALGGELSAVTRVSGAHHVLGIETLLGELRYGQGSLLLGSSGSERGESDHEEVQPGERDQVDGHLPEISVQLTRESDASGHTRDGGRDQVVQVTVGGGGELQGSEADVVKCLVVDYLYDISVLDQLVD
jgi:hypothetical protein